MAYDDIFDPEWGLGPGYEANLDGNLDGAFDFSTGIGDFGGGVTIGPDGTYYLDNSPVWNANSGDPYSYGDSSSGSNSSWMNSLTKLLTGQSTGNSTLDSAGGLLSALLGTGLTIDQALLNRDSSKLTQEQTQAMIDQLKAQTQLNQNTNSQNWAMKGADVYKQFTNDASSQADMGLKAQLLNYGLTPQLEQMAWMGQAMGKEAGFDPSQGINNTRGALTKFQDYVNNTYMPRSDSLYNDFLGFRDQNVYPSMDFGTPATPTFYAPQNPYQIDQGLLTGNTNLPTNITG